MEGMKEIEFSPEAEKMAVVLAAFDLMKELCEKGMISKAELRIIAERRNIPVELYV